MKKWEYKSAMLNNTQKDGKVVTVEAQLNDLGMVGWELVCGTPIPGPAPRIAPVAGPPQLNLSFHGILKRELQE